MKVPDSICWYEEKMVDNVLLLLTSLIQQPIRIQSIDKAALARFNWFENHL